MKYLMGALIVFVFGFFAEMTWANDPCYPVTSAKIVMAKNGAFLEINFEKASGRYGYQMVNIESIGVIVGSDSKVCFQPNKTMIAPRSYYINVPTQATYDIWKNMLGKAVADFHGHYDVLPKRH